MTEKVEISNSEWEVMRILWAKKRATSRQLIDILQEKFFWKEATIKTYIVRLKNKGYIKAIPMERFFEYIPLVDEKNTLKNLILNDFSKICQMHKGSMLVQIVKSTSLSQADIDRLMLILEEKRKNAPQKVLCDCLPEICNCEI